MHKLRRTLVGQYRLLEASSAQEALSLLASEPVSAIITDQRMPSMAGVELLAKAIDIRPESMRIILTGYTDVSDLIESINTGRVYKYITKPWEPEKLLLDIRDAIRHFELVRENERLQEKLELANIQLQSENQILRQEVAREVSPDNIIYESEAMSQIFELLDKVNPTDSTVLIQGETGTGKELIARYIHHRSPRRDHIFMAVNCGAIPKELIESEFFGHVRGAFTSATTDKRGYFENANMGTIFLDEIGEVSQELQVKLLRVLQEGEIQPVGASKQRKIDVRVLASTNRDLKTEVADGRFRQDLYYRLHVFSILIPPLRGRRSDILPLTKFFAKKCCQRLRKQIRGFSPEVRTALAQYDWPGNVRELKNEVERLVILASPEGIVEMSMLSDYIRKDSVQTPRLRGKNGHLRAAREQLEQKLIREALASHSQNRTQTARALGISRQSLIDKIRRFNLA